jgi:hypothetical protein
VCGFDFDGLTLNTEITDFGNFDCAPVVAVVVVSSIIFSLLVKIEIDICFKLLPLIETKILKKHEITVLGACDVFPQFLE